MIIDSSGRSTPGLMLSPEASVEILGNGGTNSNLCHLPYGIDLWVSPGTGLIVGNLIPIIIGSILVIALRKTLYRSKNAPSP